MGTLQNLILACQTDETLLRQQAQSHTENWRPWTAVHESRPQRDRKIAVTAREGTASGGADCARSGRQCFAVELLMNSGSEKWQKVIIW